ncbi:MAG: hypothetical protein IPK80_00070 [Nannocystis sp.]|nr:hypothetical protein [Nannocystis sp.]
MSSETDAVGAGLADDLGGLGGDQVVGDPLAEVAELEPTELDRLGEQRAQAVDAGREVKHELALLTAELEGRQDLREWFFEGRGQLGRGGRPATLQVREGAREQLVRRRAGEARQEEVEGDRLRPVGRGEAGEAEGEAHRARPQHVEAGQAAAEQVQLHLVDEGQEAAQQREAAAAPDPHHRWGAAAVRRGACLKDQLPRLEDQAGALARDQLDPHAAAGALLIGVEAELAEHVVEIDGGDLDAGRRQGRGRLHLQEAAQPRVRELDRLLDGLGWPAVATATASAPIDRALSRYERRRCTPSKSARL